MLSLRAHRHTSISKNIRDSEFGVVPNNLNVVFASSTTRLKSPIARFELWEQFLICRFLEIFCLRRSSREEEGIGC